MGYRMVLLGLLLLAPHQELAPEVPKVRWPDRVAR